MPEISKNSAIRAKIGEEEAGQRLDNYLLRVCRGVPKSHVYRILRSGEVRVDGRRSPPSYRLQAGDELRIPPLRLAEKPSLPGDGALQRPELPVIFEDAAILAIDKPAGIAVHGGSGVAFGVIEALRAQRPQAPFLELAHRLDRETSGVLLIGKKRSALSALHDTFRNGERTTDKRYLALVCGNWPDRKRDVRLPLAKYLLANGERRVRVAADGKFARTVFNLRARWPGFSLLEAELKTGRTHQIRVHLAHLGFPIAGDDKYGDFARNKELQRQGLKRMFLHAWQIHLPHPLGAPALHLQAPLPAELAAFLASLPSEERIDDEQTFSAPGL